MLNNNFRASTIQDFINVLGTDYKFSSGTYYFYCPDQNCESRQKDKPKRKFTVYPKYQSYLCNCLVCGFGETKGLTNLKKELGIYNNYSNYPEDKKTILPAPAPAKKQNRHHRLFNDKDNGIALNKKVLALYPELSNEEIETEIVTLLTFVYNELKQSDYHKELVFNKRFIPIPENYKSNETDVINLSLIHI